MDDLLEYQMDQPSVLSRLIKQISDPWKASRTAAKQRQELKDEEEETRRGLWWNTQMVSLFSNRTDDQNYLIDLEEDCDRFPEYFDDPITEDRVESWLCRKLSGPKYSPVQVATFWRQMSFRFTSKSETLLIRKTVGRIEDYNTPQHFVRVCRRILRMKKLSNVQLQEIYERAVTTCGHLVLHTALKVASQIRSGNNSHRLEVI
jgi:hypothetical protein